MKDLVLPAFEMDCRDWLVVTPEEAGLPDELADAPLLAVLSTVVIGPDSFRPASGVLTVGLMDSDMPATRQIASDCIASELIASDGVDDSVPEARRYLLPTPDQRMALIAEFAIPEGADAELLERIEALMVSFRWAA
ncbi:MAG: hypothetical protein ABI232_05655 [Jatrophihabitantaceae bacterium]